MFIQKKVCLLGDFAVGKTSLVRRFVEDRFDDKYLSTIGVKVSRKVVQSGVETVHLLLWDLAGGDDYSHTSPGYLRGAAGALVVCDLTRRDTLETLVYYSEQMLALNKDIALVYVGNKVDLTAERVITDKDLQTVSAGKDIPWLVASAKTGQAVELAFQLLTEQLVAR